MNKRIAVLLSGTAALVAFNAGQAAAAVAPNPATSPSAQSYAELLDPIPNAVALLMADDATRARQPARVQLAQYHHHHHHHHHGFSPGAAFLGGILGGIIAAPPPYYGPPPVNCYWTLGRPYWNGYGWVRPRVQVCQ